jgi:uncharacterized protein (DUF58 family)
MEDVTAPAAAGVLRRVELAVSRRVNGLREGDHLALLAGHGVEAGEARPYSPGDDVRRIDWTVTARTEVAHVRDAIAERELDVLTLVDLSASLDFGTANWRKVDLAQALLAAIGTLAMRGHDRQGTVFLTGDGPVATPIRAGRAHLAATLMRAERLAQVGGTADLGAGIDRLGALGRRRGLAVVITDFIGPVTWEQPLARLAQRHDTIAIELVDRREMRLPDTGFLTVVDPESGRRRTVDTGRFELRLAFAAAADQERREIAARISRTGADHLRLWTDQPWVDPLIRFLQQRRRGHAAGRSSLSLPGDPS